MWYDDFYAVLGEAGFRYNPLNDAGRHLILLDDFPFAIHLVSLAEAGRPSSEHFIQLQEEYRQRGIYLVHLWEDVWYTRPEQVMARIRSILGLNKKIHGRQCRVTAISQQEASDFLDLHHLQYGVKAKYRFGLMKGDDLVAVALFSGGRLMSRISEGYRSYELVRFASFSGFTVTGGFSKLLKHFIALQLPNDVMSYADRDWSLGNAYDKSGFKLVSATPAIPLLVDPVHYRRMVAHRIPDSDLSGFYGVFNTGNLKYKLYLNER